MTVLDYILGFHRRNSSKQMRDYDLCKRYAIFSRYFVIIVIMSYAIIFQLYQSPKYYNYFVLGEIQPSMGAYVPFVEDVDEGGLELIQIYNIIVGIILGFFLGCFDAVVYLVFANMTIIPTVLSRDIDDLRTILENPEVSLKEIKMKMREIILMHKMYNQ